MFPAASDLLTFPVKTPAASPVIPIPLGYITWQWSGDALQNAGTWSLKQPGSSSASTFTPSTSYPPNWSSIVTIPTTAPCGLHY